MTLESKFNQTNLSIFRNSWYSSGKSKGVMLVWYFVNIVFFINPLNPFSSLKTFILKIFGAKVGKGVFIKPSVNIKYPWRLTIGDHCWIGEGVWIDNLADVKLCDHVCISQGAMLLTGNHNYKKTTFDLMVGDIILEDGVWIGAQSIVCPGVTCHSHSVLSVGSIAIQDLEPFGIYQGNPAKLLRNRKIEDTAPD